MVDEGPREIWPGVTVFYAPHRSDWTLADAQARLRAAGRTPGRAEQTDARGFAFANDMPLDGAAHVFEATGDGLLLRGDALTITTPGSASFNLLVGIHPAESAWSVVVVALGWLVGAVAGWLLTGWVATDSGAAHCPAGRLP